MTKRIDQQAPLAWRDAPALVSPPVAARLLGMHVRTIDQWIAKGKVSFTRAGRIRKIKKADLAAAVGITLNNAGDIAPPPDDILAAYADRLAAALELPARDLRAAIQTIIDDMKNHKLRNLKKTIK